MIFPDSRALGSFFLAFVVLALVCAPLILLSPGSSALTSVGSSAGPLDAKAAGASVETVTASVASQQWTGEFQYTFTGAEPGGSYLVRGSGMFTFAVNPGNGSVTGSGSGEQSFVAHAQCSGGGDTSYTFNLHAYYSPDLNEFNIGALAGNPENYTFPEYPTRICNPVTFPIDSGFLPTDAIFPAQDGATVACPGSPDCDPRITYKITIHGSNDCASGNGGQKLIFYVQRDTFPTGHGFMQFETNTGPQAYQTDLVYGLGSVSGPYNDGFIRGPGAPQHGLLEADHPWDWRIVFHVNPCQYNAAANFVNSQIAHPSQYSLTSFNCVDWISEAASAAGLQLPSAKNFLGISDPVSFADSFAGIGDGGSFAGGVVQKNTQGLSPRNQFDPPAPNETLASTLDLMKYSLDNASALARSQNMSSPQQIILTPVQIALSGVVNFTFRGNYAPNYSLAIADYGDGSPRTATVAAQLSHGFNQTGVYPVKVAATTFGIFATFLLNVTTTPGAPTSVKVDLNVPFPNATATNSTSGPLAENVSEIALGANQTISASGTPSGGATTSVTTSSLARSTSSITLQPTSVSSSPSSAYLLSAYVEMMVVAIVVITSLLTFGVLLSKRDYSSK